MTKTVLGIFQDRMDVERAIDKFKSEGFHPEDFSIVMKNAHEKEELERDTDVAGGTLSGATTGAIVGGIAGLLAGITVPGLGAFLIGGPIAAALGLTGVAAATVSGAATGVVAGGLLGALMGLGIPREDAEYYEERVMEGAILLAVPTRENQLELVRAIFDDSNASDVKTFSMQTEDSELPRRRSSQDSNLYTHAHMGAKGGEAGEGKGWHGHPRQHAAAAKGKTVKK